MWNRLVNRFAQTSSGPALVRLGASVSGATLLAVPLLAVIGGAPVPTQPAQWIVMITGLGLLMYGAMRAPCSYTLFRRVAVTRDGALLVSDDANGTIFRVTRQ